MHLSTTSSMIDCPYCGERFELIIDTGEPAQSYIEDCYVCCRPIALEVMLEGEDVWVSARHENDC